MFLSRCLSHRLKDVQLFQRQLLPTFGSRSIVTAPVKESGPTTEALTNWERRVELAVVYRALEKYGMHEGVCNHVSTLAPSPHSQKPVMLLVPYGLYWSEVTPECFIGLDLGDGSVVEGQGEAEISASMIHRAIYRHRPDINAVVHTHATFSTVLGTLKDKRLLMLHQNSTRFFSNVSTDDSYDAVPASAAAECDRVAAVLGDNDVLVMGHHGLLTVGRSLATAFDLHYYFEQAAKVQILALQTGRPVTELPVQIAEAAFKEIDSTKDFYADAHLQSMKRLFKA